MVYFVHTRPEYSISIYHTREFVKRCIFFFFFASEGGRERERESHSILDRKIEFVLGRTWSFYRDPRSSDASSHLQYVSVRVNLYSVPCVYCRRDCGVFRLRAFLVRYT